MSPALKPWYAIATPHEDIRRGRLAEAVFAANLWAVAQSDPERAPEVYRDPEEFFRTSYMASGMKTVLGRVAAALRGEADAGNRIIGLQTAFGGGKTHILIALWHLAKHGARLRAAPSGAELRGVLGDRLTENVSVAVFTNETCDATQGRQTPDGLRIRTLWGEIAYQLGGPALYERVRPNDEARTVPQGLIRDVLRQAAPCLILVDELADYCVGAAAVSVGETTLADQTISFIQQLTQAISEVPGAVAVATLPASKYEVAQSEKGQEAFVTLEARFHRLGADVKPVADDEIYEVVRRRLFESVAPPDAADYPLQVAAAYQALYAAHAGEVPAEAARPAYREQIERAYPFHPLIIDALYTRWGSDPNFQRTRGVLRLLASVVGDLWERRSASTESQPLIQPCHLRWSLDALQGALTRLWGITYTTVIAADVLGEKSNAGAFDEDRGGDYRREAIGEGLAAAMLLGSFGGKGERSGFSAKELRQACARPGLNWNYIDGALLELENRCFYLHSASAGSLGKRYWFGTQPTLNRLVVKYRQQNSGKDYEAEILEDLEAQATISQVGTTWRVVVNPASDLPEQKALALLILPPNLSWGDNGSTEAARRRVQELSLRCGGRDRLFRNTLLFLSPSPRGMNKLRQAYRERAALEGVQADYGTQLVTEQRDDLRNRLAKAREAAVEALGPTYTVTLRVRDQDKVEEFSLADARKGFAEHLSFLWTNLVEDAEWILRRVGPVTLQETGLIPREGGLRVKDAVEAFLRFTDKPMVASREAVTTGLSLACKEGLLGIGRGNSPGSLQTRTIREEITLDASEEGVWIIPAFVPDVPSATAVAEAASPSSSGTVVVNGSPSESVTQVPASSSGIGQQPGIHRVTIQGNVSDQSWTEIFRCFIGPAGRVGLQRLKLGIHFELEAAPGQALDANHPTLKAMQEAARQLGLEFETKE